MIMVQQPEHQRAQCLGHRAPLAGHRLTVLGLAGAGGVDQDVPPLGHPAFHLLQQLLLPGAAQPAAVEGEADRTALFAVVQLRFGDGVEAAAQHQQRPRDEGRGLRPARKAEGPGQVGGKARAPAQHPEAARRLQLRDEAVEVSLRLDVKDADGRAGRRLQSLAGGVQLHAGRAPGKQVGQPGRAHRLERVAPKDALGDGAAPHIVDAPAGHPAHLRQRRRKGREVCPRPVQRRLHHGADVPPQGRVDLDVQPLGSGVQDGAYCFETRAVGLFGGHMAQLGVDHQDVGALPGLQGGRRPDADPDRRAAAGELDPGVQRAGQVVRNDSQLHGLVSFQCFVLERLAGASGGTLFRFGGASAFLCFILPRCGGNVKRNFPVFPEFVYIFGTFLKLC